VTIERGEDWGETGPLSSIGVVVDTDAAARRVVTDARRVGGGIPELGLTGGDLWRTCGSPKGGADRLASAEARRLPVDLGSVLIDGVHHWFTAHLVARRSWWTGPLVAVMNAQFMGSWNVAPKGHPNDGRLDVLEVSMRPAERLKARARLRSGSHVPHPAIRERRVRALQLDLPPKTTVWLDGEAVVRNARVLSLRVEPDALTCVV
jgi:hypothetical protein